MSQTRPPFKPYLTGAPDFSPGLKRIEHNHWLLPDTEIAISLSDKKKRLQETRELVFQQLPGSEQGQQEVLQQVCLATGQQAVLDHEPDILRAALLVSDDLCLMQNREEAWVLTAGVLAAPTHWSLQNAMGKTLASLHGPVPGGDPVLAGKINTMFNRIPHGQVFERFNWTLQVGDARFVPDAASMRLRAKKLAANTALQELYLRVERQTIIKLPKTDSLLFCIRICLDALSDISKLEQKKLKQVFLNAPEHVKNYKKWDAFTHLVQALDA